MSLVKIYVYANCGTCKKAEKWLQMQGLAYESLPIREQTPIASELGLALESVGGNVRKLFNSSGRDYREMKIKDRLEGMTQDAIFELLASHGNLIKRPFLIAGERALVGFKEEVWADFFAELS